MHTTQSGRSTPLTGNMNTSSSGHPHRQHGGQETARSGIDVVQAIGGDFCSKIKLKQGCDPPISYRIPGEGDDAKSWAVGLMAFHRETGHPHVVSDQQATFC